MPTVYLHADFKRIKAFVENFYQNVYICCNNITTTMVGYKEKEELVNIVRLLMS